jgi:hypothetical protein
MMLGLDKFIDESGRHSDTDPALLAANCFGYVIGVSQTGGQDRRAGQRSLESTIIKQDHEPF